MTEKEARRAELSKAHEGKKDEEISVGEKEELDNLQKQLDELKEKKNSIVTDYAAKNKQVRQLIDLALLANNMLKGEALNNFVKRSVELM